VLLDEEEEEDEELPATGPAGALDEPAAAKFGAGHGTSHGSAVNNNIFLNHAMHKIQSTKLNIKYIHTIEKYL
jgi:hypothetical protein